MKVAIIGAETVGRASASAMLQREIHVKLVIADRHGELAQSVALDVGHGRPISSWGLVKAGTYEDVRGAHVVVIVVGINERAGGATDRDDPEGRLELIDANLPVIEDIMGEIVQIAPDALLLVVTNPPGPLSDIVLKLADHDRVMSSGAFLDSVRFRTYLGQEIGVTRRDVSANVLGEHGTSAVLHWSAVTVGAVPLAQALECVSKTLDQAQPHVERTMRAANLDIIAGLEARLSGIGAVIARLTEAVLCEEKMVAPLGSRQKDKLTFSLPRIIGVKRVEVVLIPVLGESERAALQESIQALEAAAKPAKTA